MEGGEFDSEAEELQNNLKMVKVPKALSKDNIQRYSVPWSPNGVDTAITEHEGYVNSLVTDYNSMMKKLIDRCVTNNYKNQEERFLYNEVLHHSLFTLSKCKVFCGRQDILLSIKSCLFRVFKNEDIETVKGVIEGMEEECHIDKQVKDEMKSLQEHAESTGATFAFEEKEMTTAETMMNELEIPKCEYFTKPLVVYGPSGSGKTAMMAKVAHLVPDWLKKEPIRIIRFLGTSAGSANVRDTISSICNQIWVNYNIDKPFDVDISSDFSYLILYFNAVLWKIDSKLLEERPLVIVLDSIDQLSSKDYAHHMHWIPQILPPNVFMIISVLPKAHSCLENMKKLLPDDSRFLEVPILPQNTAKDIMKLLLKNAERTLTEKQESHVMTIYEKTPQPLFLKLLFEEARHWKSYTEIEDCVIGETVREAINKLFDKLEVLHGQTLVSKALGNSNYRNV